MFGYDREIMFLEVERMLDQVNRGLKKLLLVVKDPAFSDSDVREAIIDLERISRWKREEGGADWVARAIKRAEKKAQEYGEPAVVVKAMEGTKLIVLTEKRFKTDRPFGATDKDVIYRTGKRQPKKT